MKTQFVISLKILFILTVLLGVIYPLSVTGFAQLFFKDKANGSLVVKNGLIKGSALIGQQFNDSIYFSSRPSAVNYETIPSGASNLGPTSKKLHQVVMERKEQFITDNKLSEDIKIPSEMVFASGSGLDPHISPEAAFLQIKRVAEARHFSDKQKQDLYALVEYSVEKPQFNFLGEPRINVLLLNLHLDEMK